MIYDYVSLLCIRESVMPGPLLVRVGGRRPVGGLQGIVVAVYSLTGILTERVSRLKKPFNTTKNIKFSTLFVGSFYQIAMNHLNIVFSKRNVTSYQSAPVHVVYNTSFYSNHLNSKAKSSLAFPYFSPLLSISCRPCLHGRGGGLVLPRHSRSSL
jgi:hypothetical protein